MKLIKLSKKLILVACLIFALSACSTLEDFENDNKARAEIIIDALHTFEKNNNTFPHKLQELVPDYLEEIPTTTGGQDYFYSTDSTNGFILFFEVKPKYGCGYSDKLDQWECSSGD